MLRLAALIPCIALMSGCFLDLLGATAITSTLQKRQLETGQRVLDRTTDTTTRINLEQAIASYHADKGYFPASLDALAPAYIASVPKRGDGTPFGYDPASGRLLDGGAQGMGPTPADHQKMQQIHQAINAYGHATGWYPPTLEALVPQYLAAVPYTDSGQPFLYNNQNGDLRHPNAHLQQQYGGAHNAPRGGGAAGGPMGEALTGIGMQRQLQNMNQSGASNAGTRARENINQQRGSENEQRQNRLLEDLGV
jgi:hypothetical protein